MFVCLYCQETLRAEWKQEQEALVNQFADITGYSTSEGRRLLSQHEWILEFALREQCARMLAMQKNLLCSLWTLTILWC